MNISHRSLTLVIADRGEVRGEGGRGGGLTVTPDRPFHNFRASQSDDQRFRIALKVISIVSKIAKGMVGSIFFQLAPTNKYITDRTFINFRA